MPRVIHFEIPAENTERCSKFWQDVFGWEFSKWEGGDEPYYLVMTGDKAAPGIDGGMMQRKHPEQPVVNTLDVDDIDAYIQKINTSGGEIVVDKMPIPGVGWLAYFKDTEQNIFGIMQMDQGAGK
jgi:predicted enzyme related to lactoylglutathione lyase